MMKIFKGKSFFLKSILLHLFLVLVISTISFFFFENSVSDMLLRLTSASKKAPDDIVMVMIDNKSINTYRWPWARSLYAEIVEYLDNYTNSKVIIHDAILNSYDTERPPSSDQYFFDTIKKSDKFISGFMAIKSEYNDNNAGEIYDKKFKDKYYLTVEDFNKSNNSDIYKSVNTYPPKFFDALKYNGSVNFESDYSDGYVRKAPDLIYYKGYFYPSLSLRAYLLLNESDSINVSDKYISSVGTNLKILKTSTSFSNNVEHRIRYYKLLPNSKFSHKTYSAIDIINSNRMIKEGKKPLVSPDEFDGKIVVIGANAMNVEDELKTPVSNTHPGADVQATVLDNLLNNDYLVVFTPIQNIVIIIILSILTFIVIRMMSFFPSLLSLLGIGILYYVFCILCFNNNYLPLVLTPLTVQLSTMIFGYSYRFILEGKNKEKIKNAMGKYLSQDIMKNVVQNIDDIKLGGKKANVTVLFSDIRGFTSMSEKMTAEEVSVILNEYFSEMEPIVSKYNGVINKFIGDAVMAIFGEPVQDINHPQNAVKCAYEMLRKVEQLREKWLLEGKPKIEIGIGINTGEAFVGNIGSEKRLEYTVIGDTVNLASRIEGYNKVYKTNFLISSSTYSYVSDMVDVIKIADVTIRGKSKKMDIYEVLRLS